MNAHNVIPVASPVLGDREEKYVLEALRSGWVSSAGPFIERFEAAFGTYVGAKHAISVCNGTVALHLALHALGIGPGDEVIVPDLTFVATAHSVLQVGATPVFVDVKEDTWCLDPEAVSRAISNRTRAIIPVHLFGHPAEMDALKTLVNGRQIFLMEDAAEAHGAETRGRRVGAIGDAGAFSFYGNKLLTTGEGGMVVTNDGTLASRIRFLKDHGMAKERRYYHTELAFNYRMTNLQAALGLAQLERLDEFIAAKRRILGRYRHLLGDQLSFNVENESCKSVYWMASAILRDDQPAREVFCRRLAEQGIDTRPFFVPMSELPHLSKYRRVGRAASECPVASRISRRGVNLPSGAGLSDEDVERVARAVKTALNSGG